VYLLALLALPVAIGLLLYASWRRRRALAQLGRSPLLRQGILLRPGVRRCKAICLLIGVSLLAVACAQPQWGDDPSPQERAGRDVILVLDLSRSMSAEQPSRHERALRGLRQLADTFEANGGNRVALVLFAAEPRMLFPLTQDYDHLRHALTRIEKHEIPALAAKDSSPVSGTRIGAALKLAADMGTAERVNRPVIVLLSDGDDPGAADEEWLEGVMAAKKKQIPVHTVGIGDPLEAHSIPAGKERLLFEGQPVQTKLNEDLLREIAQRTGGTYLPAHGQTLPLGSLIQYLLDADAWREVQPSPGALPVYQQRYQWFLLPAVLLFMVSMLLNEGRPAYFMRGSLNRAERTKMQKASASSKWPAVMAALTGFVLIGAAPPAQDEFVRQGNEAFERQDYEASLKYYERAEVLTQDPGLVAFNRAAAHYHLKNYREAMAGYRRCLDDDRINPWRRARAHFDLGNALLQQAGDDAVLLSESAAAYRACLQQPIESQPGGKELLSDARHNLELAQLLWLRARPRPGKTGPDDGDKRSTPKDKPDPKTAQDSAAETLGNQVAPAPGDPSDATQKKDASSATVKSEKSRGGMVQVLPDQDPVRPMSIADTLTTLEREARRIADLRRKQQHGDGPATLTTKDW
jgi:Ca-activated chloride channel family protein